MPGGKTSKKNLSLETPSPRIRKGHTQERKEKEQEKNNNNKTKERDKNDASEIIRATFCFVLLCNSFFPLKDDDDYGELLFGVFRF